MLDEALDGVVESRRTAARRVRRGRRGRLADPGLLPVGDGHGAACWLSGG